MLRLLLCVGAAVLIALLLRARPAWAVVVALGVWGAIPAVAAHQFTGQQTGLLALHPATWIVLATFAVQLLLRPASVSAAVARHPLLTLVGLVFVVGCLWTSQANDSGGIKLLFDQILAPLLAFLLVVAGAHRSRADLLLVRAAVLALAAAQAVLAMVQSALGRMIFFESDYETLYWFDPLKFDRWMGTTDSPLILAYLLGIAAALAIGVRSVALRFALLGTYLVGVLITQSRLGVAVVCGVALYAVVRSRMRLWTRALAAVAVAAAGYVLVSSTLVAGFASRLADDTGSFDARRRALAFIFGNWTGYLVAGEGLTASYTVARGAGLQTSIESSILMYVVDVGWVLALVYFGAQLAIVLRHGLHRAMPGLRMAAALAVIIPHTSSALAWSNLSGLLLWVSLALPVVASALPRAPAGAGYTSGAPALARAATSAGP